MEQKIKVFKISATKLQESLQAIKEGSYFPHFDCILNDLITVADVEKIAKFLGMDTVFIFKSPNKTYCHLTW